MSTETTISTSPEVARKPRLSRGFKLFLGAIALPLLVIVGVRFVGALDLHGDVKGMARSQVQFVAESTVDKTRGLEYGLDGVGGIRNDDMATKVKRIGTRDYVLTVTGRDNYTSSYDSRTGFYTNGCSTLACWFN